MTIVELIDNMAEFLKPVVADYNAHKDSASSEIIRQKQQVMRSAHPQSMS